MPQESASPVHTEKQFYILGASFGLTGHPAPNGNLLDRSQKRGEKADDAEEASRIYSLHQADR